MWMIITTVKFAGHFATYQTVIEELLKTLVARLRFAVIHKYGIHKLHVPECILCPPQTFVFFANWACLEGANFSTEEKFWLMEAGLIYDSTRKESENCFVKRNTLRTSTAQWESAFTVKLTGHTSMSARNYSDFQSKWSIIRSINLLQENKQKCNKLLESHCDTIQPFGPPFWCNFAFTILVFDWTPEDTQRKGESIYIWPYVHIQTKYQDI